MAEYLSTGGSRDPLLPRLLAAARRSNEIDLAVAFIKESGLNLLYPVLEEAVDVRRAALRILTSDYLDVTDPKALRQLMLLGERGADVRMFLSGGTRSFHLKAYIYAQCEGGALICGSAFVGSSNISRTALTDAIEWNYRIDLPRDQHAVELRRFLEIRHEYDLLLKHESVRKLDHALIEEYELRRKVHVVAIAPGSDDREDPSPIPNAMQTEALNALSNTRSAGFQRGLVVMATGLGKTHLAAFDVDQLSAQRVLFVAHREEILLQSERTFLSIRPRARVGRYTGTQKDDSVDFLFASVQTLGRSNHLETFDPKRFDYIVVDEFHHAAAPTYRRLLIHFQPTFLLGLTATPDRTDQSSILSLCDDNLVFTKNLFYGIEAGLLCPFTYYGIHDETIKYEEIPWRNGKFDPETLSNKLATMARARHAQRQWLEKAQSRTLAFCVSIKHANFMAARFRQQGIRAEAVHGESELKRDEALERLQSGELQVVFSVDLFNEGVDIPSVDTILLLRPTESKVLFLQQLGRGLRIHEGKERVVILDFIGNHRAFLNRPQALFGVGNTLHELADFAQHLRTGEFPLPPGCYANFDLRIIEFLASLAGEGPRREYTALKQSLGRRPTMTEYYRSGSSMRQLRQQHGQWWKLVEVEGDLTAAELECLGRHEGFFRDVETTAMTRSFKAVLLESLLEHNGFLNPPSVDELAMQALAVFRRRRQFIGDIHEDLRQLDAVDTGAWSRYWRDNPVHAWIGGNRALGTNVWFEVNDNVFRPTFVVDSTEVDEFHAMTQELVEFRLASYESRGTLESPQDSNVIPFPTDTGKAHTNELPYFPNLRIACGHFRTGRTDADQYKRLSLSHGQLDPARYFIARAAGNSMDGGKNPVRDGDYLLLEHLGATHAGSITGDRLVIERQDASGDDQYLLRLVTKDKDGNYVLKAANPDYEDLVSTDEMTTLARLEAILDPLELMIGEEIRREEIPKFFGEEFNPGNWNSGHVAIPARNAHVLFVTINKQGKSAKHRYQDHFIDEQHFHWQSQDSTTPESKRGKELLEHAARGISIHLFVRDHKLHAGKAAPFRYYGPVQYVRHTGSAPISVVWELQA